jgi:7-cyano-7-deazaguanine synthase
MMSKQVILFSGGMDSATLVMDSIKAGNEIKLLSVHYGQRHKRELHYAEDFVACVQELAEYPIDWRVVNLENITPLISNSSQTGGMPVPHGAYDGVNMRQTVVPNRNMIMLSVAIGYAINLKYDEVLYGAHAGDHTVYPDCRPEFVQALALAGYLADWHHVQLRAPYVSLTKGDICLLGTSLGVPYELTWTCYQGDEKPCGKCGSCDERADAFKFAGVPDPLL